MDEGVELLEAPTPVMELPRTAEPTAATSPEVERKNPMKVYIEGFQKSDLYKEWFDEFYAGKTINPSVTEDMKKKVYEQHGMSLNALYEYSREVPFHYTPKDYPQEVQEQVVEYLNAAKEHRRNYLNPSGPEDRLRIDGLRKSAHNMLADSFLQQGYVSNFDQGKYMAHLITIDSGLDTLAPPMTARQCAQVMASQSQAR